MWFLWWCIVQQVLVKVFSLIFLAFSRLVYCTVLFSRSHNLCSFLRPSSPNLSCLTCISWLLSCCRMKIIKQKQHTQYHDKICMYNQIKTLILAIEIFYQEVIWKRILYLSLNIFLPELWLDSLTPETRKSSCIPVFFLFFFMLLLWSICVVMIQYIIGALSNESLITKYTKCHKQDDVSHLPRKSWNKQNWTLLYSDHSEKFPNWN